MRLLLLLFIATSASAQVSFPITGGFGTCGVFNSPSGPLDTCNPVYVPSQPMPVGGAQWDTASNYNDNSAGSLAQINSLIYTSGSRYAAALNATGVGRTSVSAAWGANLVGIAETTGAYGTGAQIEAGAFASGTHTYALILSVGGSAQVGHNTTAFMGLQSNAYGNSPSNGIIINGNNNAVQSSGALLLVATPGVLDITNGFDLRHATFSGCTLCAPNGTNIKGNGQIEMYNPTTTGWPYLTFGYSSSGGNGVVGSITNTGSSIAYNTTSDQRLKSWIKPLSTSLVFDQIKPVTYTMRGQRGVGFLAQEVYAAIPEAVTKGDDNPKAKEGDVDFKEWQIDKSALIPHMWAEIQSLRERVRKLEQR